MAKPKSVAATDEHPLFRVLEASETVSLAVRTREMSANTQAANDMLKSLVASTPKSRSASVPTTSFPNVRQNETPKQRAQACRSFVKRWATDNGNPFSSVALSSDYASLVITRSK